MKILNQELWDSWVAANKDPYGACCVQFAEQWADEMERLMADGSSLKDVAQTASSTVDQRPGMGITGFMYGAAVSMLAQAWEHGENLRRWHNNEYGVESESGTVNPAILVIGGKS